MLHDFTAHVEITEREGRGVVDFQVGFIIALGRHDNERFAGNPQCRYSCRIGDGRVYFLVLEVIKEYPAIFHGCRREQVIHGNHVFAVGTRFGHDTQRCYDEILFREPVTHVIVGIGTGIVPLFPRVIGGIAVIIVVIVIIVIRGRRFIPVFFRDSVLGFLSAIEGSVRLLESELYPVNHAFFQLDMVCQIDCIVLPLVVVLWYSRFLQRDFLVENDASHAA